MRGKYVSTHGHWLIAMKIYLIQPAKWSPEASNQGNEIPEWVPPVPLLFNSMPLPYPYRAWNPKDSAFVHSNLAWKCGPWKYWDFGAPFLFLTDFKLLFLAWLMSLGFIWLLALSRYLKRAVPYAAHAYSVVQFFFEREGGVPGLMTRIMNLHPTLHKFACRLHKPLISSM